jgi:hypothetical protein
LHMDLGEMERGVGIEIKPLEEERDSLEAH